MLCSLLVKRTFHGSSSAAMYRLNNGDADIVPTKEIAGLGIGLICHKCKDSNLPSRLPAS